MMRRLWIAYEIAKGLNVNILQLKCNLKVSIETQPFSLKVVQFQRLLVYFVQIHYAVHPETNSHFHYCRTFRARNSKSKKCTSKMHHTREEHKFQR